MKIRLTQPAALRLNTRLLLLVAIIDFIRGVMHTFFNEYAAETFAQIEPHPDALFLLGAFGISNFATSFLLLLIYIKAKQLAPYVLLTIFLAYIVGIIGVQVAGITMQSAFYGQYMMYLYLFSIFVIPMLYFISGKRT